jgi:hypothetical protein
MTIDKKINYNDQKLTKDQQKKIKPVKQAGGMNYLGKQETVTVPKKWLSSPDHVVAELAYITPREQKILLDKNLYGSLKGKPNKGPGGIMSLQGDMGSVGGGKGGNTGGNKGDGPSARDRAMGLQGKTGTKDKSLDVGGGGVDRSKVGQFSQYGKNVMAQNLKSPSFVSKLSNKLSNIISPKNIFSGLLGLINPAFGLFAKGLGYLGTKAQDLRGYNPDGTPRTQEQYEQARRDRQIQGRIDAMTDRMLAGKTFSQKNLDSLLGMTDMYGNQFSTNLGNIDNVRGSNLRGILNSDMPVGVAPMNVDVPTGILNTMAIDRFQPSYSFGIPDPTGKINTDQFTSSDGLGIYDG